MATLGGTNLTMLEMAKMIGPDGMVQSTVNVLAESNPLVGDMYMLPSNMVTGHQSSIQTGLPTVSLKRFNEGTASTRSTRANITDGMAMLEARSVVDADMLETYGNAYEIRRAEAATFTEAMGQKAAELMIYGSVADDVKEFNGLDVRYNALTGNIGKQVLSAGGTGIDLASIWLIAHKPSAIHAIYPKNTTAGLQHKDLGLQVIQDATGVAGAQLDAFVDKFLWQIGLVVRDYRYVVRIANIEEDQVVGVTSTQALTTYATNVFYLMNRALERIPNLSGCRPVFYVPRTVAEGIRVQALATKNANVFTMEQSADGMPVTKFAGVPVKIVDQLLYNESAIS